MGKSSETAVINKIILNSAILVTWSVLTVYIMGVYNSQIHWSALGVYLLVVILSLADTLPVIIGGVLAAGSALIVLLNYRQGEFGQNFYLYSGLTLLAIWTARYLSKRCIKAHHGLRSLIQQNRQMLDQFIVYDPETGLMRQAFAEKALSAAIARNQRLKLPLSLMMIDVPKQKEFPNAEKYATHTLFADLFLKNLRSDVDIPFLNNDNFGVILPEMDLKMAQITAQEMAEDIANVLDIGITIGIATMTSKLNSVNALISGAKSALETGLEIGQPIVTHQLLAAHPKEGFKFTEILDGVQDDVLMKVLQNPNIGKGIWIIWLNGIQDISTIKWIKEKFQSSPAIQFLTVWGSFVVVKLISGHRDTHLFAAAFPDWIIQDIDREKRFVLIAPAPAEPSLLENYSLKV